METVRDRRSPRQVGLFVHGQRVHVSPQADRPAGRSASAQQADDTGAPNAATRLEAPFLELPRDNGRSPTLLEADLGMSVKIPPDSRELVGVRFNLVDRGHGHARLG
jgi:hypothetical protein